MVHHPLIFLLFLSLSSLVLAQDERFYRQILTNSVNPSEKMNLDSKETQFTVKGSVYFVDLNDDGIDESINPQKRDGVDWLEIKDSSSRIIFEHKLLAMGSSSTLYKVKMVYLSTTVRALILFLDEGVTKGRRFESTSKLYFLTLENKDLNSIKLFQGPHYFHEKENIREQYWRRGYSVNVYDIDQDGTREIAVQYNHIQRIYRYLGLGEWKSL